MAIIRRGSKNAAPKSSDGSMTLVEHLRELRNRLFVGVVAIFVGFVVGLVHLRLAAASSCSTPIESVIDVRRARRASAPSPSSTASPRSFILQLKVALVAGIVIASPIWLYELWAFIMPGLHRNERKWTMIFVSIAGPLFLAGVALGYYVMPKGLEVLLGFTPTGVTNLVDTQDYLNFMIRVLLVFGVSFEIPLFVVLLNLAGVVKARHLARCRAWIIFGTFVFAAVATPSTDPITMVHPGGPDGDPVPDLRDDRADRGPASRRERPDDYSDLDDDEQSPL